MSLALEYGGMTSMEDADRHGVILQQCFNVPTWEEKPYYARLGLENYRVLRQGSMLLGGLSLIPMGQWFGGQRVAMTGIAGVAIGAEHRGKGAALFLIQQALQELYASGVALSTLYPAIHRLYRNVGYDQGGTYCCWSIAADRIRLRDRPLAIHPVPLVAENFHALYQRQAQQQNGNLDRHPRIWHDRLRVSKDNLVYAYLLGPIDQPEGYLIIKHHHDGNDTVIQVQDWALLTPAAVRTFWSFLANQRSQIDQVRWRSSAIDPLTVALVEPSAQVNSVDHWLLRLVNVPLALEQRGYPAGIQTELHLAVQDHLLAANHDRFILTVHDGKASVTRGGRGDLQLDVRGLASLYSSLFTPSQLRTIGHLEGSDSALATAALLFAGGTPWLPDFF